MKTIIRRAGPFSLTALVGAGFIASTHVQDVSIPAPDTIYESKSRNSGWFL